MTIAREDSGARRTWGFVLRDEVLLPVACLLLFLLHLHQFTGSTALDYYPGVIDLPAAALSGDTLECPALRAHAGSAAAPIDRLQGVSEAYNLDQRLGEPVLLAPFYATLSLLGFRVAYAFFRTALFLALFLLCRRVCGSRPASYLAALAVVLNPYVLSIRGLNPNAVAILLVALCLLAALRASERRWMAAASGAFAGVLFGVAHPFMALLALPSMALAVWLACASGLRAKATGLALFAAGLAPLLVAWQALSASVPSRTPATLHVCLGRQVLVDARGSWQGSGQPGEAPIPGAEGGPQRGMERGPQRGMERGPQAEMERGPQRGTERGPQGRGFDPCTEERGGWHIHRLGPLTVSIWGMLNWPLHDRLVRSGSVPFPFMLYIPAHLLHTFGALVAAAALVGLVTLFRTRERRRLAWPLLAYLLLVGGFLSVQENIGGYKFTFVLWLFLPVGVLAASGLSELTATFRWRAWAGYAAALLALWLFCQWLSGATFPLDDRWQRQFGWKGVSARIGATEETQAGKVREELSRWRPWPWSDPSPSQIATSQQIASSRDALAEEAAGRISPSEGRTWLALDAVRSLPAGSLVVLNSYIEAGPTTLADPERCVVRAPALKPAYGEVLERWLRDKVLSARAVGSEYFLVDSLAFPVVQHLAPESATEFGFNGYTVTYRVRPRPSERVQEGPR